MPQPKKDVRQVHQFDKVLKENMDAALPGIIKNLLKIDVVHSEELPDSLQHTKEREPDVLKKITDRQGATFVLHIEFQLENEPEMVYRMAEYYIMLMRAYKLEVRQQLIHIGSGTLTMPSKLETKHLKFHYPLLSLSKVDYRLFLRSKKPEEKILAILGDFGEEDARVVANKIVKEVVASSNGDLVRKKHINQLRILAQLRNLVPVNADIMESIEKYISMETDYFYIKGLKKGEEQAEKKLESKLQSKEENVVVNLLQKLGLSVEQAAEIADVSPEFVKKVKQKLKRKSK